MKIFVDAYLLNKEHQGTKTYISELYKEFAKTNKNSTIYFGCFFDLELEKEFVDCKNIKFIHFKQKSRVLRMFFEIPRLIKKHEFEYAHFQYVIPFVRNKQCKYIVTIHDVLFNDFKEYFSFLYRLKRNFLFKNSAKKSDYLLTVSQYSKKRIQKLYKLEYKEVYITPNGVREEYFEEYNQLEVKKSIKRKYNIENYVLYVSRIEPRKNQQALLQLFLETKDKALQLVFIGDESLENIALKNKLVSITTLQKQQIHFLKNICDVDLLDFYRAAKVFVYPSLAEGFGIPPIEAAALKIPVLCSKNTAMKDFTFFKPYHIDMADKNELKNKFREMLVDINLERLVYIQNEIRNKYSWKFSSDVLTSIIYKN